MLAEGLARLCPQCRGGGGPASELLPAARRQGRDKGGMGMTERGKGVTAGSNKIKLGKGNEGLMIEFSTAKSIQFGKHSSRRVKTRWGINQLPRKRHTWGAAEQWPGSGCRAPWPACPAAASASPRPHSPSRVSPAPRGGDAPLAEMEGDGDAPLGEARMALGHGWPHSRPTPWPWDKGHPKGPPPTAQPPGHGSPPPGGHR